MKLSFKEKSIWISLIITILLFGIYFTLAFTVFTNPYDPSTNLIGLFVTVITVYIIIQIILQAAIALVHKKEAESGADERDHLIELKATRISYFILACGVWIAGTGMVILTSQLLMAHIIILFFILAEVVGFSTQLFYYRRGV